MNSSSLLAILIALLLLFAFSIPGLMESWVLDNSGDFVKKHLGVESSVQDVKISPLKGLLELKGISLKNPKDFSERNLIHIQTLTAHVSLPTLLTREIEIDHLLVETIKLNIECRESICNYRPLINRLQSLTSESQLDGLPFPSDRNVKIISADLRNISIDTRLAIFDKSLVLKINDIHLDNPSKVLNGIRKLDSAIKVFSDLISGTGLMKKLGGILGS